MSVNDRSRRPVSPNPVQPALACRRRPGRHHPGCHLGAGPAVATAAVVGGRGRADPVQHLHPAAPGGGRHRATDRIRPHSGGRDHPDLDGGLEWRHGQPVQFAVPDPDRAGRVRPAPALGTGGGAGLPARLRRQRHLRPVAAGWLFPRPGPQPLGRGRQFPDFRSGRADLLHPPGTGAAPARTGTVGPARTLRPQRGHRRPGHPCRLGGA